MRSLTLCFSSGFAVGSNSNDQLRQRSPAEVLGFRPKNVTQEMVRPVSAFVHDSRLGWCLWQLASSLASFLAALVTSFASPLLTCYSCLRDPC